MATGCYQTQSKSKDNAPTKKFLTFVHVCRKPIVLKGRLWIRHQNKENKTEMPRKVSENQKGVKENGGAIKKTVETNGKLRKSNSSARNNSSGAFVNQGGFSGEHTVQKQIKDNLKGNQRRPNVQFETLKQKKGPNINSSGLSKKTPDVGFTGEKGIKKYIKGTLKKHLKEPSFPSQRPSIQTTRCNNMFSMNFKAHIMTIITFSQENQNSKTVEFWEPSRQPMGQDV